MLRSRFGDPFRIEQEHLYRLQSLTAVRSSSNVTGLRRLYDTLQSHVRGLTALKVSTSSYAAMLMDILLRSLPLDIVVQHHRRCAETSTSTSGERAQDLMEFIRIEVESHEKPPGNW